MVLPFKSDWLSPIATSSVAATASNTAESQEHRRRQHPSRHLLLFLFLCLFQLFRVGPITATRS